MMKTAQNRLSLIMTLSLLGACGKGLEPTPSPTPTPAPVTSRLDVPSSLRIAANDASVKLGWDASVNAETYKIYYGTSSDLSGTDAREGSSGMIQTSQTSITLTGLTNDKEYQFAVSALSSVMLASEKSSVIKATPKASATTQPLIAIDSVSPNHVTLPYSGDITVRGSNFSASNKVVLKLGSVQKEYAITFVDAQTIKFKNSSSNMFPIGNALVQVKSTAGDLSDTEALLVDGPAASFYVSALNNCGAPWADTEVKACTASAMMAGTYQVKVTAADSNTTGWDGNGNGYDMHFLNNGPVFYCDNNCFRFSNRGIGTVKEVTVSSSAAVCAYYLDYDCDDNRGGVTFEVTWLHE